MLESSPPTPFPFSHTPSPSKRVFEKLFLIRTIGRIPLNPPFQGGLPDPIPPFLRGVRGDSLRFTSDPILFKHSLKQLTLLLIDRIIYEEAINFAIYWLE